MKKPAARRKKETAEERKKRAGRIVKGLHKAYPDAKTALDHADPFHLLVATILSAQCTDAKVNETTPRLFARFPDAAALAAADLEEVEGIIHATGFFRQKAKSIVGCAKILAAEYGGKVPREMDELTRLPGVGRKTANCIRGNAMGLPGMVVDTHVGRLAGRLGLSAETDAVKVERDLMSLIPEREWTFVSNALIWHGRRVCIARKPKCGECSLLRDCPTGQGNVAGGD